MTVIKIGDTVQTKYNSGLYLGKVIEDRRNFWLIKVQAVLKHPEQGDLHKPNEVTGVAFHERKALAYKEKMNARKRDTVQYTGQVPTYEQSLKNAIIQFENNLKKEDTPFNKASLLKLNDLKKHFYHTILNDV